MAEPVARGGACSLLGVGAGPLDPEAPSCFLEAREQPERPMGGETEGPELHMEKGGVEWAASGQKVSWGPW